MSTWSHAPNGHILCLSHLVCSNAPTVPFSVHVFLTSPAQDSKMTAASDTGRQTDCLQVRTARELGPAQPHLQKGRDKEVPQKVGTTGSCLAGTWPHWCDSVVTQSCSLLIVPSPSSLVLERSPHPPFPSVSSAKAPSPCWHEPRLQGCPGLH